MKDEKETLKNVKPVEELDEKELQAVNGGSGFAFNKRNSYTLRVLKPDQGPLNNK